MDIQVFNLVNLNLLWAVAVVAGVVVVAEFVRRRTLSRFATANLLGRLLPLGNLRCRALKALLGIVTLVVMVVALIDIRWGKTEQDIPQKGIEVMFALDVSRSMLAQDVTPNRLERAKQQINDMVDEMAGDRIGLVVFAGEVRQITPLTSHYNDFKQQLDEVGTHTVRRGGSLIGEAIRVASDGFLEKTNDHKAIVLFTDGEDHESEPLGAAKDVFAKQGIRIFTVGLGDAEHGARVPMRLASNRQGYLTHNGQQVWSRMDGQMLKKVAMSSDGAYIPAGVKQVDMAGVYRDYVAGIEQIDFQSARINSYIPRYQWLVGVALVLILIETLLVERRRATLSEEKVTI